jgi:type I restriction enzyme S subunit
MKLSALAKKVGSGATPRGGNAAYKTHGVPLIRSMNVHFDGVRDEGLAFIDEAQARALDGVTVHGGDVLLNITGASIGRVAVAPGRLAGARVNQHVCIIRATEALDAHFLKLFLNAPSQQRLIMEEEAGATRQALTKEKILNFDIPLPPLNEQRRIVAKLDSLQERSRRARESLDAVPALLDKLRQSILAAAFRGDLTRDFREKHKDLEPASKLLQRIRTERRKKWEEAELAKLTAKGKPPTDDKWKSKYKEPESVDPTGLPKLPDGWCWASLETISDAVRGIPYGIVLTGDPVDDGIPTVRCGDIKAFEINLTNLKRVKKTVAEEFERTRLEGGEVLLAIRGTVGATAVVSPDMAGMNISREVAMIPVLTGVAARYLMFCLVGPEAESRLLKFVKGVAQAGINLADLRNLPVPLPPSDEQRAILDALECKLTVCTSMNATQQYVLGGISELDRAILAKAFRGELVPQDPSDEPADVMLARTSTSTAPAREKRGRRPGARESHPE